MKIVVTILLFSCAASPPIDKSPADDDDPIPAAHPPEMNAGPSRLVAPTTIEAPTGMLMPPAPTGTSGATESSLPITLGQSQASFLTGAASNDGGAVVLLVNGQDLLWAPYSPTTGWGNVAALPGATSVVGVPKVAMDDSGNVFVAWLHRANVSAPAFLYAMRYEHSTSTWGSPTLVDNYGDAIADEFDLAAAPSGDAALLYQRNGAADENAHVSTYSLTDGMWHDHVLSLAQSGGGPQAAAISIANGTAIASWRYGGVQYFSAPSGAGWTSPSVLSGAGEVSVDANEAGDLLIGFYGENDTLPHVAQYSHSVHAWSAPTGLSQSTESIHFNAPLLVGLSSDGSALYGRCFSGVTPRVLQTFSRAVGGQWAAATALPVQQWPWASHYAFDKLGGGVAIWYETATSGYSTGTPLVSLHSPNTGWSAPVTPAPATTVSTTVAFSARGGRAWVGWQLADQRWVLLKAH